MFGCIPAFAQLPEKKAEASSAPALSQDVSLPVIVRENQGQWDPSILYQGTFEQGNVRFMNNKVSYAVLENTSTGKPAQMARKGLVWEQNFIGALPTTKISAAGKTFSTSNYFNGKNKSLRVPDYNEVDYSGLYNGIDLRYYGKGPDLEYDFVVHPNAKISDIKIGFEGVKKISLLASGGLDIKTEIGKFTESRPASYQVIDGKKREVDVRFVVSDARTLGFKVVGNYDKNYDLVIDPIIINWCTYVGGKKVNDKTSSEHVLGMCLDSSKNVYVTGYTTDGTYPVTAGVFSTTFNGIRNGPFSDQVPEGVGDVFVFKLDPTGSFLLESTFIGGKYNETGRAIYVNAKGEIFVAGATSSPDFPVTKGAYDTVYSISPFASSRSDSVEGFVLKLDPAMSTLKYSTFLGGDNADFVLGMKVNANDEAFVTGATNSLNFPTTTGCFQPAKANAFTGLYTAYDVFVTRLNNTGTALIYSTYVGGKNSVQSGRSIAIDNNDNAYVTGQTNEQYAAGAHIVTTAGAYNTTASGGYDAFVFKLDPTGSTLIYSTLIGGSGRDNFCGGYGFFPTDITSYGTGIAVSATGEVIVGGSTESNDFPITPGVIQPTKTSGQNGFVTRLNAAGSAIIFSTYVGGSGFCWVTDIKLNDDGDIWVAGTGQPDQAFSTGCPLAPIATTWSTSDWKVYMVKMDATGQIKKFSEFMGGNFNEYPEPKLASVGHGCNEEVWGAWSTDSFNVPTTTNAYKKQKTTVPYAGEVEAIAFMLKPKVVANFTFTKARCDSSITFTADSLTCLWVPIKSYIWDFGDGTTGSGRIVTHTYTSVATFNVKLVISCPTDSITKPVTVPPIQLTANATPVTCSGAATGTATVNPAGGGTFNYSWTSGDITQTANNLAAGTYTVTVTISGFCPATASVTVTQPAGMTVAPAQTTAALCKGSSDGTANLQPSGGASPYTYTWTGGSTSATAQGLAAGTYTVTITDAGGCTVTASATVTEPTAISLSGSSTNSLCGAANGTASVNPSGGNGSYSYQWSSASTSATASGLLPATYTVTVTDLKGCSDTLHVTVSNSPTILVSKEPDQFICPGDTASLNASGGLTYSWSPSAGLSNANIANPKAYPSGTTEYTVTVTAGTCTGTDTVDVTVYPAIVPNASPDTTIISGTPVTLTASGGTSYLWQPSGATGSSVTVSPVQATTYTVFISNSSGCKGVDSVRVNIDDAACTGNSVFVPSAFSPNGDGQNDLLMVRGACIKELLFIVYDRWGESVFETQNISDGWNGIFRGEKMQAAVFVYRLEVTLYTGQRIQKKGNVTLIR